MNKVSELKQKALRGEYKAFPTAAPSAFLNDLKMALVDDFGMSLQQADILLQRAKGIHAYIDPVRLIDDARDLAEFMLAMNGLSEPGYIAVVLTNSPGKPSPDTIILQKEDPDTDVLRAIRDVADSFSSTEDGQRFLSGTKGKLTWQDLARKVPQTAFEASGLRLVRVDGGTMARNPEENILGPDFCTEGRS